MTHVEELQISWRTLVTYRDLALEHNDWERVTLYNSVIEDLATMIQSAGGTLPSLDEVRR